MKRPTDTDLLRKAVQEKLRGASETPPPGGFQRIQEALSEYSGNINLKGGFGIGLSILCILITTLILLPKEQENASLTEVQQEETENRSEINGEEEFLTKAIEERRAHVQPEGQNSNITKQQGLKKSDETEQDYASGQSQPPTQQSSALKTLTLTTSNPEFDGSTNNVILTGLADGDLKSADKTNVYRKEEHQENPKSNPMLTQQKKVEKLLEQSAGSYSITKTFSLENLNAQNEILENPLNSNESQSTTTAKPNSITERSAPNQRGREEERLQLLNSNDVLHKLKPVNSWKSDLPLITSLPMTSGSRIWHYIELSVNTLSFTVTHIDRENFVTYNQPENWSTDQLVPRLAFSTGYLLMRNIYLKGSIRYTYFSRSYQYDVGRRIQGASIDIGNRQEPVYYIVESRNDVIRHHGIGLYSGMEFKLAADRYMGLGISYSKSLSNAGIDTSLLIAEGHFSLANFAFNNSWVWVEFHFSHGLNSWKRDIINYKARFVGLNFKYELKGRK